MTDSFENLMNSRFDQITAEEKKVNVQQAIQEKQDVVSALQHSLIRKVTNVLQKWIELFVM